VLSLSVLQMICDDGGIQRARMTQGTPERASTDREIETSRVGVQPRTPARHRAGDVDDQPVIDDDHPQQGGSGTHATATHARANGTAERFVVVRGEPGAIPSLGQSTASCHSA